MKLSLLAIAWLAQSLTALSENPGCVCPDGLSPCTTCFFNDPPKPYKCSQTCNTQCLDFANDPNNCGFCGNVCPTGTCKQGQCVTDNGGSCPGGICGTFQLCSGNSCYCLTNTEGQGYCGADDFCLNLARCNSSSDCPSGHQCAANTCCQYNVCAAECQSRSPASEERLQQLAAGSSLSSGPGSEKKPVEARV